MAHKYKVYEIEGVGELKHIANLQMAISALQQHYEGSHKVAAWIRKVDHKTQSNYWVGMDNDGKLILKVYQI